MIKNLISIITVTYNCEETIERTIKSVIRQKKENIEYIIVDGGSTDSTLDRINEYKDNIDYIISEPDKGIYDAMNKGIRKSRGEWIAFINGDDWYSEDSFIVYEKYIKESNSLLYYGKVAYVNNAKGDKYIGISTPTNVEELHFRNLYCHQGLLFNRALFEKIGLYSLKYSLLADYDWNLTAHDMGINPYFIDETVAFFSAGGASSSERSIIENYEIISKHYRNHSEFPLYLEKKRGIAEFNLLIEKGMGDTELITESYKSCYIWGTGEYGVKCLNLLEGSSITINGFVESNPLNREFEGYLVYTYDETLKRRILFSDDSTVLIIATEKYEEDIKQQMIEDNIPKHKYILMSQMFLHAYNAYVKNMKKNI